MAKDSYTYEMLQDALRRKELAPVYLFHGEEDFLIDEATEAVVKAAVADDQRGFNLDVLYGNETDARDVAARASAFPMMAERRVVVVREFDRLPNRELLASYLENPSPSTCLVLQSTKPDFRKKPFVTAKRAGPLVEFKPLYNNQVPAWVQQRVKQFGRAIDPEGARLLAEFAGTSLRELQNELDKLFIYIGERKTIAAYDVRSVVGMSREFNIFELQRALGTKNSRRTVEILEHMLESGESPTTIVLMLTRYFSLLWKLWALQRAGTPSQEMARTAGIHPFFVKDYLSALESFSANEIEEAFEPLAHAELQLKTGGGEPRMVLLGMVLQLLHEAGGVHA